MQNLNEIVKEKIVVNVCTSGKHRRDVCISEFFFNIIESFLKINRNRRYV